MKKNGVLVFLLIVAVFALWYLGLPEEQAENTLSQRGEISFTDTQVEEPVAENPQVVSDEKTILSPPQQRDSERLRQEAEQRFEKLARIEGESGKPIERGKGLQIRIEVPTPTESTHTE